VRDGGQARGRVRDGGQAGDCMREAGRRGSRAGRRAGGGRVRDGGQAGLGGEVAAGEVEFGLGVPDSLVDYE
jgi:hypothetical protein